MNQYTVIWYYEQGSEVCIDHVTGKNGQAAAEKASVWRKGAALIAVFQGCLEDEHLIFPI